MTSCNKCDGSGLLPFILPDGTTSIHSKVHCSCHPIYGDKGHIPPPSLPTEGYRPPKARSRWGVESKPKGKPRLYVNDFDFAMSYEYYRSLCLGNGWRDPGSDVAETQPEPSTGGETDKRVVEHIHRSSNMSVQDFRQLQDVVKEVKYLRSKVDELSKSKPKTQKFSYKGIR